VSLGAARLPLFSWPCSSRSRQRHELHRRQWYILASTHSTVKVSLQVIVVTLLACSFHSRRCADRSLRPPLPRRHSPISSAHLRPGTAYTPGKSSPALASVRDDAHHRHRLGNVLATVNALVQDVIPTTNFPGLTPPSWSACKAACSSRSVRRLPLRPRGHRRNPRHRRPPPIPICVLPLSSPPRLLLSPRASQTRERISESTELTAEALESAGSSPEIAEAAFHSRL